MNFFCLLHFPEKVWMSFLCDLTRGTDTRFRDNTPGQALLLPFGTKLRSSSLNLRRVQTKQQVLLESWKRVFAQGWEQRAEIDCLQERLMECDRAVVAFVELGKKNKAGEWL